jgi:hypothetical protein
MRRSGKLNPVFFSADVYSTLARTTPQNNRDNNQTRLGINK